MKNNTIYRMIRDAHILVMYQSGIKIKEIAKKFGLSYGRVYEITHYE